MANIGHGRPLRGCDACGITDDHPRHIVAATAGGDADVVRHLDCCAAAGCPLPADDPCNCAHRTAGLEHLRGANLLAHLGG